MKETVTFLEAVQVRDHNGKVEFEAKAGEVVELVDSSARRWISRGKAQAGKIEPQPAEEEAPQPVKKKTSKKTDK